MDGRRRTAPLSLQQEDMALKMRTHPVCADVYDLVWLFELAGELDADRLAAALDDLAIRHGALRTTIEATEGGGVQRVAPGPLTAVGRARAPGATAGALAAELLAERLGLEALEGRPLFRARLVSAGPRRHLLALTIHHLVYDGWSVPRLWRDLSELYAARLERRPARLPPLERTYADFAHEQRVRWHELAPRATASLRALAAGCPRRIAWPRPAVAGGGGPYETRTLALSLPAEPVHDAARAARVSPFLVLMAASAAAAGRVTGHRALLLGTDAANREDQRSHEVVGPFVNTRFARASTASGLPLEDVLRSLRASWLDGEDRRDVYGPALLRALGDPEALTVRMVPPSLDVLPSLPRVEVRQIEIDAPVRFWQHVVVTWSATGDVFAGDLLYRRATVDAGAAASLRDEIAAAFSEALAPAG